MSQFYQRRPRQADAPKGAGYFHRADPDGVVRDLTSKRERLQKVDDCQAELEAIECAPAGMVADVGCGVGTLLGAIARGRPDDPAIGVEPDPEARAVAEEYSGCLVYPGLASVPWNSCAGVLCYHVIEHVDEPEAFVQDLHRILEPGGLLVISTPDFDSPVARVWGDNYRMLHDPTHISLFSTAGLVGLLEATGFMVDDVWHPWPYRFRTRDHVLRLLDDPTNTVSPPAPGNHVSVMARRVEADL